MHQQNNAYICIYVAFTHVTTWFFSFTLHKNISLLQCGWWLWCDHNFQQNMCQQQQQKLWIQPNSMEIGWNGVFLGSLCIYGIYAHRTDKRQSDKSVMNWSISDALSISSIFAMMIITLHIGMVWDMWWFVWGKRAYKPANYLVHYRRHNGIGCDVLYIYLCRNICHRVYVCVYRILNG